VDTDISAQVDLLKLSPRETIHLHRVLRLKPGDTCQVFNRKGWGAQAIIETISRTEGAQLRLVKIFPSKEKSVVLKVGQALPQKKKMDDLIKQAEELGVDELWVLETERTVVKMSSEGRERAKARWERVVIEAAKQSGNPALMRVEGPVPFEKALEQGIKDSDTAFLFHPGPSGLSFSSVVEKLRGGEKQAVPRSIFLFFGPEGGFSEREVRLAESQGIQKVFLGDTTLRVETAFLGVVSAVRFLAGGQ